MAPAEDIPVPPGTWSSFEIKLLNEFWQEFTLCTKLKFVDALLLLSELAAKI